MSSYKKKKRFTSPNIETIETPQTIDYEKYLNLKQNNSILTKENANLRHAVSKMKRNNQKLLKENYEYKSFAEKFKLQILQFKKYTDLGVDKILESYNEIEKYTMNGTSKLNGTNTMIEKSSMNGTSNNNLSNFEEDSDKENSFNNSKVNVNKRKCQGLFSENDEDKLGLSSDEDNEEKTLNENNEEKTLRHLYPIFEGSETDSIDASKELKICLSPLPISNPNENLSDMDHSAILKNNNRVNSFTFQINETKENSIVNEGSTSKNEGFECFRDLDSSVTSTPILSLTRETRSKTASLLLKESKSFQKELNKRKKSTKELTTEPEISPNKERRKSLKLTNDLKVPYPSPRPKRAARPKELKEPPLNKKLRRNF